MYVKNKMRKLSLLLALSLVLTGIPFPGNARVVQATESAAKEQTPVVTSEVTETSEASQVSRLEALKAHAETALLYGRNVEGALYPQLFVDGIDPVTKEAPIWNKFTNDKYYVSNLYGQSLLLKMMEGLTWMTEDDKYKDAAYTQVQMRYDNPALADENGLFYAGDHALLDIMTGKVMTIEHETKDDQLPVELYYRVDPEGYERFVTAYWNAHIFDPSCLVMNRHGEFNKPLQNGDFWSSAYTNASPWIESDTAPFIVTANDMIDLAGYLSVQTGDPKYIVWGERLLQKYIDITNEDTGLTGPQYGIMYNEDTDSRDRFIYNFAGADFVDATGVDYKTLTEDDYEICGESMRLAKATLNSTTGFGPQVYINLYEQTGNEKYYDFVKGNMLGLVRYVYDPVRHVYKTPMSTNGTDFNPGEGNGSILVAPRAGYYLKEGQAFVESETPNNVTLLSLIDTVHMLKDEDATERAELWEVARTWATRAGLGDIGTALGENVNVNLETTSTSVPLTMTAITLYKHTGHRQYYDLAVKMGDNIVAAYFNEETGLFTENSKAPYVKFNSQHMYAVYCVEAMTQGMLDQINLDYAAPGVEVPHDGLGSEKTDAAIFYNRSKVAIETVDLGAEEYALVLEQEPDIEIADISGNENERAIRQMVALGVMDVDANGNFAPNTPVSRGELVRMVVELFGFNDASVPADFRFTDLAGKSYYEAVVKAENAGILDENLGATLFDGDSIVTREEMASIIVKALQVKMPEESWYVADSLYRIQDADSISAWAKDYVDIATNYRLMMDVTEDSFAPTTEVTKGMAAYAFQNICRYIELPQLQKLTATITPYNADRQMIAWETSDATVLEVDEQGRLYPLKGGSVAVTATADGITSQIEVTVSEKDGWMLKEVSVDGEVLADFNANVREYALNLYLGTTTVPEVSAVSFSGEPVEITLPKSLPGTVELNVDGYAEKYTIDIDNTLVEYTIDEDFNHEIDTSVENVTTERYNWYIAGTSTKYNPYWKIVPRNQVNPGEEYGCMWFPYRHELPCPSGATARLCIGEDYAYAFGPQQDDMLLVVELEFAVKNMANKVEGFNIAFSELLTSGSLSFTRINIVDNEVRRLTNTKTYNKGTVRTIEDDRFYKLQLVVDKKTGKFSYYLDGELLEKDVAPFHNSVEGFGSIAFGVPHQEESCDAEMFFDNIKVYELQKSVVEATFDQIPSPTNSPKPTALPDATAAPTATPKPTATPVPTATPTVQPTFEPMLPFDVEPTPKPKPVELVGRTLILNDDIGVTFYLDVADTVDKDDVKVKFTLVNQKTSEVTMENAITKSGLLPDDRKAYGFSCGLYAYEMNQSITADVYIGDVKVDSYNYSVEEYCESQLAPEAGSSDQTKNLIYAMLQYGQMSQIHFGRETGDLVGSEIAGISIPALQALDDGELAGLQSYPKTIDVKTAGKNVIGVKGMTLVLFAETALRAGFTFGTNPETGLPYELKNFTFEAYQVELDAEGNVTNVLETIEDGYTGTYEVSYFDIPNINPKELDNTYQIIVKKDGVEMLNIIYSPFTYIKNKLNSASAEADLVNVVTALYRYNEAAENYNP